jgi:hypothetical protein
MSFEAFAKDTGVVVVNSDITQIKSKAQGLGYASLD